MQHSWLRAVQRPRVEQTDTKKKLSDRSPRRRARRLPAPRVCRRGGARILKGEAYAAAKPLRAAGVYVMRHRAARWRQCSSPTLLRVSLAKTLG